MTDKLTAKVARAIDRVQLFSRYNDWTSDAKKGFPIEICRYGKRGEPEIVVVKRFRKETGEAQALRKTVSRERATAAISAIRSAKRR